MFESREAAEAAATAKYKNLKIGGKALSLAWGKSQNALPALPVGPPPPPIAAANAPPMPPGLLALMPSAGTMFSTNQVPLYPSMDPTAMGTKGDTAPQPKKSEQEEAE